VSEYRIELRPGARKALLGLGKPVRRRLQRRIDGLAGQPHPQDAIALVGHPGTLRIKVGEHRVVYTVRDHELLVLVIDIGHRCSATTARSTALDGPDSGGRQSAGIS
jgi:mRNA interferase RelE/StbE